jgi:hypothetical protein
MPMAASSTLLWIHHDDDPALPKTHELRSTIKQHVMVNYHAQKTKRARNPQVVSKSSRAEAQTTRAEHVAVGQRDVSSLKPKRTHLIVAGIPSPAPGLIGDDHRNIYNAIWWHRYAPLALPKPDEMDWAQKWRVEANELLWNLATEDKTFFEIFMCFAAAKEIAIKGSTDLRAYFRYKGRAITMVSQDVNRKSHYPSQNFEVLSFAQLKVYL